MTGKQQTRLVELKRRIKLAMAALRAVDDMLELEQADTAPSPDNLADRIRNNAKAAATRGSHS